MTTLYAYLWRYSANFTRGVTIYTMLQVYAKADCGNAPKKQFIYDFCVAIAEKNFDKAALMLTDNASIAVHGHEGADHMNTLELLRELLPQSDATELTFDTIITHGNQASANGVLKFSNDKVVNFSAVFLFNSFAKDAKIKEVQIYPIAG